MGSMTSSTGRAATTTTMTMTTTTTTKGSYGANGDTVQGSHVFQISRYSSNRKRLRVGALEQSAVFAVGGYNWQIGVFPAGLPRSSGDYLAVYVFLVSKNKAARVKASAQFSLVDVTGGSLPPHTNTRETEEFDSRDHSCTGFAEFMKISELEESPYLHKDCLTIECVVTVVQEPRVSGVADVEVPPSDITEQLGKLLRSKEDADVTFQVGGEAFPAHKTVLAMRSPVFRAALYGPMREKDMSRIIVGDMQPAVFDALLHFVYTDSLPAMDDLGREDYIETIRHLLVAADRYAMERLKIICESILSKNIDVKNVMTTAALADQHHCGRLNDACVNFIGSLGTKELDDVMASQGYAELKSTSPLALVELWEKKCRLSKSKS